MTPGLSSPFDAKRTALGTVGKCIYCRRSDLELDAEHIIPYGLNGNQVLLAASCKPCAAITSAFEFDVLRHVFLMPRRVFRMHSRHTRDDEIAAKLEIGERVESISVPAEDAPVMFALPMFLPPSTLDTRPFQPGIQGTGVFQIHEVRGIARDKLRKKHGGPGRISFDLAYSPTNFARMIAKIAYGFAVAHFGLDEIEDLGIVSSIKGETDDIGRWVGCVGGDRFAPSTALHSWQLHISFSYDIDQPRENITGQLSYKVSLFSLFGTPEYTVIVGNVKHVDDKFTLPI